MANSAVLHQFTLDEATMYTVSNPGGLYPNPDDPSHPPPFNTRRVSAGGLYVQTTDSAFSGTISLQVSIDGINFVTSSATINNAGYVSIPEYAKTVRFVVSAGPLTGSVHVAFGGAEE